MSTQRPFLIGVAGGTCSGKTTVSERLAAMAHHTDDQLAVIKLDSYYRSHGHLSFQERVHLNYDHPDAFDWVLIDTPPVALLPDANLLTAMADGAILAGPDGYILLANEAARKMLGVGETPSNLKDATKAMTLTPPLEKIMAAPATTTREVSISALTWP